MDYKVEKSVFMDAIVPPRTASYSPVPNRVIVDHIQDHLRRQNIPILQESYRMNSTGNQFQCTFVTPGTTDLGMALYITNSYDKSRKFSVGAGAVVFRCSNGLIRTDLRENFSRKHTGDIMEDVDYLIYNGIKSLRDEFDRINQDKEQLESFTFKDVAVLHELIGKMWLNELVLTTSQFSILHSHLHGNEWHTILDEDNRLIGNPSMWDFYNNVTEALKSNLPFNYVDKHVELHNFLLDEVARY